MNETLLDMCRYGDPMLFFTGSKWVCKIDMRINISGAEFKLTAREDTPDAAVQKCHQAMFAALQQLSQAGTSATRLEPK